MNRDELHELVMLLKDGLASGDIKIRDSRLLESLGYVRFSADGKVDPHTVNSHVKAAALAADATKTQREMRKIPLIEVQTLYFEMLDQFFGKPFSEMKKNGLSPAQIAEDMASQNSMVRAFEAEIEEFRSGISEFWSLYAPVVDLHVSDLKYLKSVFGGDVFPSYTANIACSVGLYMDTVILPDPLLRILSLAKVMAPRESFRLVVKHALSALDYRDLALAEVNPPIVVVAADPMYFEPSYMEALQVTSEGDLIKHASRVFGRQFSSAEELQSFLSKVRTSDELVAKVFNPKRFLFDSDWSESPTDQYARYVKKTSSQMPGAVQASVAEITHIAFLGRMMQTNDLLFRSARYRGTPLIDAPTSWQYLLWKYEYDAERADESRKDAREIIISKAIASEGSTDFGMLSGVPPQALIELRRNGAMASLRETIRAGINEIDLAAPDALSKVADEVIGNIDRTFEEHDHELKSISSSHRKFFGLDVSRWVVTGGISVAATLAHNVGLAVLAALSPLVVGSPSIPDLRKQWKDLQLRSEKLQRSPVAILFRHLGHKFGFSSRA